MDTASFQVTPEEDGWRARIRGLLDEERFNSLLRLVPADQPVRLDLRDAHLSLEALLGLRRLAAVRPWLELEPDILMRFVRGGNATGPEVDLTAIVAHELRSPLALIHARLQGLAQTLQASGHPAQAEVCFRSMRDLATTTRLFDLYLTAAQPWRLERVALRDVLKRCLQELQDAGETQEGSVRLEVEGPAIAYGHPGALQQLIVNLVLNAVRADRPHADVSVRLRPVGADVEVTVADNGPGFPAAVLEHPFVPYRTDRTRGTGLGLVICKWIVDRHHGRLTLNNRARGAVVTVVLPQAPAEVATRPTTPATG